MVLAVSIRTSGAQQTKSATQSTVACDLSVEQSPVHDRGRPDNLQQLTPRPENQALDKALPGFFKIPGTENCVRFGAGANAIGAVTSKLMSPTWFITSSIPVAGQPFARSGVQTASTANESDVNVEFRSNTDLGSLRVVIAANFAQPLPGFVLSVVEAYGEVSNVLIGLTSTAFADVDAYPATLDFQGPNAMVYLEHMVVRYSYRVVPGSHITVALEQPSSNIPSSVIAGVFPRNAAPDFAINWRVEGSPGHVQLSGLARVVGQQNAITGESESVAGLGGSLAGSLDVTSSSSLMGGVTGGKGLGAYINDIGGHQYDAATDSTGAFEAIPLLGAYVGLDHTWTELLSSTATFGWLGLDDRKFNSSLGPKGLYQSKYASLNLVARPFKGILAGVEALWGHAIAIDGSTGEAWRGLVTVQFRY